MFPHEGLMIRLSTQDEITRIHLTHWRSRLVGYSVSAWLVRGVLIDTGFPAARGDVAGLIAQRRPRAIVLTHVHEDHAGNAVLAARHGLPVAAPHATLAALREGEAHVGFYRRVTWSRLEPLAEPLAPLAPDELAATGLALVHTPGHSPDHHVVWDAERRVMFGGDLFLGVKVRVARPDEDPRLHARSLRVAAALRPRVLLDAHRGEIADPVASLLAKADWLDEAIHRIDELHARGWIVRAITRDVLGPEPAEYWFSVGDLSKRNFVRAVLKSGNRDRNVDGSRLTVDG